MLLGIVLMVAEAFTPTFGALGAGGVAAFVVGSLILIDTDAPGFGLSIPLILVLAVVSATLLFAIAGMAIGSHRRPVVSGAEELIGAIGHAESAFPGQGSVQVHGEVWTARSEAAIAPGEAVTVTGRDGLTLLVAPRNGHGARAGSIDDSRGIHNRPPPLRPSPTGGEGEKERLRRDFHDNPQREVRS
jgi:membrane-bound serine protease (ClpP class)